MYIQTLKTSTMCIVQDAAVLRSLPMALGFGEYFYLLVAIE